MAPHAPSAPSRRRRLRSRLAGARRRAAVLTGAALMASGAGVAVAPAFVSAPLDAPNVAVQTVDADAVAPPPATLLPPTVTVSHTEGEPLTGGRASYYGADLAGNPTASGERFDPSDLTAAHRTLPFGTRLRVTHAGTGESVVVRVNDRGPFHGDRVIDVSRAAADAIGLTKAGTGEVEIERLPTRG